MPLNLNLKLAFNNYNVNGILVEDYDGTTEIYRIQSEIIISTRCWFVYLSIMKWQSLLKRNVKRAARNTVAFAVPVDLLL